MNRLSFGYVPSDRRTFVPVSVHVVVERYLLVLLDIPLGEDTHPDPVPNEPFCYIGVGVTAVVCKTTDAAPFGCVDELCKSIHEYLIRFTALAQTSDNLTSFF